ncbi:uncharacterized protein NPIL_190481 [Nephila pilipes]|uniref:Uncharacterized protein n=1 Tax=Nephila pilipes TaxID=299642 RepID=A0A8X6T5Y0_NEPPI|nr:uncharacterized protein NPIL_190481 [Nephila pilipes]
MNCVHRKPNLQVYRFNQVDLGISSSPFLLAATIRRHFEKYEDEFLDTVELLDRNYSYSDLIYSLNELIEALHFSRKGNNITKADEINLRKWISTDANLMKQ